LSPAYWYEQAVGLLPPDDHCPCKGADYSFTELAARRPPH
jgi:hypothetical protein